MVFTGAENNCAMEKGFIWLDSDNENNIENHIITEIMQSFIKSNFSSYLQFPREYINNKLSRTGMDRDQENFQKMKKQ